MWMGCGDVVLKGQVRLDSDVDMMATDLHCASAVGPSLLDEG